MRYDWRFEVPPVGCPIANRQREEVTRRPLAEVRRRQAARRGLRHQSPEKAPDRGHEATVLIAVINEWL
ncbi:hypothetical protein OG948_00715 [Embleya sp. NBC_00888]|uniref:hypothetical protein n=1 Tax=Embleya sp. NBC_00888 TaxID=2975960 RepID=UPI00386FC8DC|nr:hypothetical protein OG948_00715 [Embleya sp. NBC_00888]